VGSLRLSIALLICIATPHVWSSQPLKTLRVAFPNAEDGFDPGRISDRYSHAITLHVFESLYAYDYLAIPAQIRPLTAAAMPEHSPDYRTWTISLRPGIYFTPDAAFRGERRELTAADYVYSFKRYADPAVKSPHWVEFEELGIKAWQTCARKRHPALRATGLAQPLALPTRSDQDPRAEAG